MKLPYGLLATLHRKSEGSAARPLHALGRTLYGGPLLRVAAAAISRLSRERFELRARHSVVAGGEFNLFASDLDCTAVLAGPFDLKTSDRVRLAHAKLRAWLPQLGELEIFSRGEWDALERLHSQHAELLGLMHGLMKIRWMEWKLAPDTHEYHRYKMKKAIRRSVGELEGKLPAIDAIADDGNYRLLGEGFSRRLKSVIGLERVADSLQSVRIRSNDLRCDIGSTGSGAELTLDLDGALLLLALLPTHSGDDPRVVKVLEFVRADEHVRRARVAVLSREIVYANAAPRIHLQHRDGNWGWVKFLEGQLRAVATPEQAESVMGAINFHGPGDLG